MQNNENRMQIEEVRVIQIEVAATVNKNKRDIGNIMECTNKENNQ